MTGELTGSRSTPRTVSSAEVARKGVEHLCLRKDDDEGGRTTTIQLRIDQSLWEESFSGEAGVVINTSVLAVASYAQNVSQPSHRALFGRRLRQVLSCPSQVFFPAAVSV